MEKIERIDYITKENGDVEKVLMIINDGFQTREEEIFLGFTDVSTNKRYLMHTSNSTTDETEKVTFLLSTLSLQNGNYILEGPNNEDYNEIQLPIINMIGLNGQKDDDEIIQIIEEKFGSRISILDLKALKNNVENFTISSAKPAKKANVPVVIANGIKKFYLARLNKLLKEIHNASKLTPGEATKANEELDKIDVKLDDLATMYAGHKQTAKVKKSLDEIQNAKNDIEQAKNKINNIVIEPSFMYSDVDSSEYEDTIQLTVEEDEKTIEEQSVQEVQPETSTQENITNTPADSKQLNSDEQVASAINLVTSDVIEEISASLNNAIQKMAAGISEVYKAEITKIISQHAEETQKLTDSLNKTTSQLSLTSEQLNEEKSKTNALTEEKQTLTANNEELTKKNADLTSEKQTLTLNNEELSKKNAELADNLASKDEQLSQQNSMIESFREEIKSNKESSEAREQELLKQIQQLKDENSFLMGYKQRYEQIASMFGGQTVSQPVAQPQVQTATFTEAEMNEAIDHSIAPHLQPVETVDSATKTL